MKDKLPEAQFDAFSTLADYKPGKPYWAYRFDSEEAWFKHAVMLRDFQD